MENKQGFPIFPSFFCFIVFILVLRRIWKNSSSKLPPGPIKLPIIGDMLHLLGSLPHHRLRDLAKRYGPIMHLKLGEVSTIVISSPEAAKQVLKTHDVSFAGRPFSLFASIIMYGSKDIAFAPYGAHWKQMRKISNLELLSTTRVQSFRSIREEEVLFLVNSISSSAGSPINLTKMLFFLSNAITLRSAFGSISKQNNESFILLVQKIVQMVEGFTVADLFPSIKFLPVVTGMKRNLEKMHQEADAILENIINEHRKKRSSSRSDSKDKADDSVDILLNLQHDSNLEIPLTINEIKAVMLEMFLAGTEPSATPTEWAMSELIRNPRVMKKAQAEIRQLFDQKQQLVNETSLQDLKYFKLVIKETLRLHAPVPLLIPKESRERVELNGYEIPANTKVIINAWAMGRDPSSWNEPEKFYPERFLNCSIDYKGNDFEFIPFGAGRRMCPGISYGMAIAELLLANLLYHFDWKVCDGTDPQDLDMSESFGAVARRKNELQLIPIIYNP